MYSFGVGDQFETGFGFGFGFSDGNGFGNGSGDGIGVGYAIFMLDGLLYTIPEPKMLECTSDAGVVFFSIKESKIL